MIFPARSITACISFRKIRASLGKVKVQISEENKNDTVSSDRLKLCFDFTVLEGGKKVSEINTLVGGNLVAQLKLRTGSDYLNPPISPG